MTRPAANVDDYLAQLEPEQQKELRRVRAIIRRIAPDAIESISYGMPTYKVKGKKLIYFAAFKRHMSLFCAVQELEPRLSPYCLSHRGTVQFTAKNRLPTELIEEIIVRFRRAKVEQEP